MLNARPGENILEIGFGTGHSLVTLARAVSITGTVTGLDISEGMLCITQSRLTHSSLVERVALNLGDAANLPFETARFDAVFVSFTLELFDTPEIPKVLEESARVLRPGGRLGVVALARRTGIAIKIYEWAHVRVPDYFDCRPIFVREVIEMAGFQVAGLTERSMWGLPVDILVARKTA
jgi:ubiquinone/menaquinone biosynthesis C-methylase UbiE